MIMMINNLCDEARLILGGHDMIDDQTAYCVLVKATTSTLV